MSTTTNEAHVSCRVPEAWQAAADALVARLAELPEFQAHRVTRSMIWRMAIQRGLEALEAEHPPAKPRRKRATKRSR